MKSSTAIITRCISLHQRIRQFRQDSKQISHQPQFRLRHHYKHCHSISTTSYLEINASKKLYLNAEDRCRSVSSRCSQGCTVPHSQYKKPICRLQGVFTENNYSTKRDLEENLIIESLDGKIRLIWPPLFELHDIPDTRNDIPTPESQQNPLNGTRNSTRALGAGREASDQNP